jgi:hypothetical protein
LLMRDLSSNRGAGSTSGASSDALAARVFSTELVAWLGAAEPPAGSLRVVEPVRVVTTRSIARPMVPVSAPVRTDPWSPWSLVTRS